MEKKSAQETVKLHLECGTMEEVISNVTEAVWGDDNAQPGWAYTADPGLCQNSAIPTGRMMMVPKRSVQSAVADACLGHNKCVVELDRHVLGVPKGFDPAGVLALSVAVQCKPMAEADLADAMREEAMASKACSDGCHTCSVESEADDEEIIIGCYDNSLIVDIDDASYAADAEQPKWWVNEAIGMCNASSGVDAIPKGEACRTDDSRVIQQLRRRCVGRRRCVFTWAEIKQSILPVDTCPGKLKRLSVMAQCRRGHVPMGVLETALPEEFSYIHYEERRLASEGAGFTSVAIKNAFHARAAFETATEIIHQYEPKDVVNLAWGDIEHDVRAPTYSIVRRIMATFTTPASDKATDASLSLYTFKVQASELFWRQAGVMAMLDVNLANDMCDQIGGCDLTTCHKEKVMVKAKATIRNRRAGVKREEEFACTFTLHLKSQQSYALVVYGITNRFKLGAKISLTFKPPRSCVLAKGCGNPLNSKACKYLSYDDMPWQAVKTGQWPEFRCSEPNHVEAYGYKVETKPFWYGIV